MEVLLMDLAMLGVTGAGKGTHAERLEEDYEVPHISSGDLLRENRDARVDADGYLDEEGAETIGDILDRGEAPPTETMVTFLEDRLDEEETDDGYILDGFPRWEEQAEYLDGVRTLDAVVYLRVDDDEVLYDRLLDRGREDDDRETISERLDWQRPAVEDLQEYYRDHEETALIEVDAAGGADEVYDDIVDGLEDV